MNLTKEQLNESNYTGARLIKITNPTILKYKAELEDLQKEINPFLEKMEVITKELDPIYNKIQEHNKAIKKLQEELAEPKSRYDAEVAQIDPFEVKAQAIKNKMQPLVVKELEGQLAEFEKSTRLITKDDVVYAEIVDEIEELIKAKRQMKAKEEANIMNNK